MTSLSPRQHNQMADLLDRIAALEAQVRQLPARTASQDVQNLVLEVSQASHGFNAGDVIRHNGTTWVLADELVTHFRKEQEKIVVRTLKVA